MKKTNLIIFMTIALISIGLGDPAWGKRAPKDIFVPGNTVVHDPEDDLLLVDCADYPENCSVPGNVFVPGYADIEVARITEVGKDQVDLSITPVEPILPEPEQDYLAYYWQFQDVCMSAGSPTDKKAMVVTWQTAADGEMGKWSASWVKIDCETSVKVIIPIEEAKITFEEGGIAVRVSLNDLLTENDELLKWFAGVRLLSPDTAWPVDVVPAVMAIDYEAPTPTLNFSPENFATWVSH